MSNKGPLSNPLPNPWIVNETRLTMCDSENCNQSSMMVINKSRKMKGGYINPDSLPKNEAGYRMCRWCSGSVLPPKRTFCSADCIHEHRLRTQPKYVRQCCYYRDKGICAICRIDTKKTAKQARELTGKNLKDFLASYNIGIKRKIHKRKLGGGLWDADHIVRVTDGGGLCGMNNIRTLCISCHKKVTKEAYVTKKNVTKTKVKENDNK